MLNLFQYIRDLFQEAANSSPSVPAEHKLIERTPAEKADYIRWSHSLIKRRLVDWLNDQYAIYRVLPADIDRGIDFLDTPSSKGFVVHFYKTNYTRSEVTHFFDYLKERVLAQNYRSQISDTRTYARDNWVETVERHYLKPRQKAAVTEKLRQRFGNITIDLTLRDDKVHQLKLRATHYQDQQFHDPEEFSLLMQLLFTDEV